MIPFAYLEVRFCIDFYDTYFLSTHVVKGYKLQYLEFSFEISLSKCRTLKTHIFVGIALQWHPGVIMLQHLRLRACPYSATPTPPNLLLSLLVTTLNNTDYNMERVHSTCIYVRETAVICYLELLLNFFYIKWPPLKNLLKFGIKRNSVRFSPKKGCANILLVFFIVLYGV